MLCKLGMALSMTYNLISYKNNDDKKCWTVLNQSTGLTPLYSIIYSSLKLAKLAPSTQRRHMTAISQFYEYIQLKHNDSFESYFSLQGLRGIISQMDGFSAYLDGGRKGVNIISLEDNAIDVSTSRVRIEDVFIFLNYLNNRYTTAQYNKSFTIQAIAREQISIGFLLRDKRNDLTSSASKRGAATVHEEYKSLTPFQCAAFLKIIYPSTLKKTNPLNPFSTEAVSFRNYMICTLMLEYGLRRGEINLLETDSFKPSLLNIDGITTYYIVVTNCEDEESEEVEGRIKTIHSHRTLKITKLHYSYLCAYVNNYRKESNSSILFLSSQKPKPLTLRMLNKIFERITRVMHKHFPDITELKSIEYLSSCHPHQMRHTWAVAQLHDLVVEQGMSITDAKDLLRINGGWSIKSEMPDHYGRRFLADQANAANLRHIFKEKNNASR